MKAFRLPAGLRPSRGGVACILIAFLILGLNLLLLFLLSTGVYA